MKYIQGISLFIDYPSPSSSYRVFGLMIGEKSYEIEEVAKFQWFNDWSKICLDINSLSKV